jgi:hypothetical protein
MNLNSPAGVVFAKYGCQIGRGIHRLARRNPICELYTVFTDWLDAIQSVNYKTAFENLERIVCSFLLYNVKMCTL